MNSIPPENVVGLACVVTAVFMASCAPSPQQQSDTAVPAVLANPLPSWNDGPARQAILDFVARVTDPRLDRGRHETRLEVDLPV